MAASKPLRRRRFCRLLLATLLSRNKVIQVRTVDPFDYVVDQIPGLVHCQDPMVIVLVGARVRLRVALQVQKDFAFFDVDHGFFLVGDEQLEVSKDAEHGTHKLHELGVVQVHVSVRFGTSVVDASRTSDGEDGVHCKNFVRVEEPVDRGQELGTRWWWHCFATFQRPKEYRYSRLE